MMLTFRILYQGYGSLPINHSKFKLNLPDNQDELIQRKFSKIVNDEVQIFKKAQPSPVIALNGVRFN